MQRVLSISLTLLLLAACSPSPAEPPAVPAPNAPAAPPPAAEPSQAPAPPQPASTSPAAPPVEPLPEGYALAPAEDDEPRTTFMPLSGDINCVYTGKGGISIYMPRDGGPELICERSAPTGYQRVLLGPTGPAMNPRVTRGGSCCSVEPVMRKGTRLRRGPFTCEQPESEIVCRRDDGHGFAIGGPRVRLLKPVPPAPPLPADYEYAPEHDEGPRSTFMPLSEQINCLYIGAQEPEHGGPKIQCDHSVAGVYQSAYLGPAGPAKNVVKRHEQPCCSTQPVIREGAPLRRGPFTCELTHEEVVCQRDDGHGFALGGPRVRVFAPQAPSAP
jgi:hypothetical protein